MVRFGTAIGVATVSSVGLLMSNAPGIEPGELLIRTSTMLGSGIPTEDREKLSVAVSRDGVNWTRLFRKPTLTNFSRDASIIRHGAEYVTVYTDAFNSADGTFGLARSTNLVHWTATNVTLAGPAMIDTPNNTWAPEWFVDGDRYFVMVRSSQQNNGLTNFPNYAPPGIGYLECLDPGTWTNWTDFTPITDLEPTYENDPFIIRVGSTYHLFTDHFNYPGGPAILHRQSTSDPFSGYGAPVNIAANFASAPAYLASGLNLSSPWEGQFVLPLGDNRYRLYFQAVWHDASFCIESHDGMQTWDPGTMQWLTYDGLPAYGHGSVLRIPHGDFLSPAIAAAKLPAASMPEAEAVFAVYNASVDESSRMAGRADVVSDPAGYGLYTSTSIMDLNLGGLMIQKSGSDAMVRLQMLTTTNLSLPFTNHAPPVEIPVELPGDQHFLRIRALGP